MLNRIRGNLVTLALYLFQAEYRFKIAEIAENFIKEVLQYRYHVRGQSLHVALYKLPE